MVGGSVRRTARTARDDSRPETMNHRTGAPVVDDASLLTDHDIYLFREGSHFRLFEKLGAHPVAPARGEGVHFSVWAPEAERVSVIGDFNDWQPDVHALRSRDDGSGI